MGLQIFEEILRKTPFSLKGGLDKWIAPPQIERTLKPTGLGFLSFF